MTTNQRLIKNSLFFNTLPVVLGAATGLIILNVSNPLVLFAIVIGMLLALGVIIRPEWGLLFLVFMIYTRLSDVLIKVHGLPSISKPIITLLLLIILIRWFVYKQRPENWAPATFIISLYGLLGFLSLFYAVDQASVLDALADFGKDAIIAYIVVTQIQNATTLRHVIWTLLFAGIFLGSISTFQYFSGTFHNNYGGFGQADIHNIVSDTGARGYRIGGPGLGTNAYGRYLLMLVPLALDRFWREKMTLWRMLAAWAFFVTVLSIFLTFSRSAFLALVVVLAVMFIRSPPKLSLMVATSLIAIVLLISMPAMFTDRLSELTKLLPGGSRSKIADDVSLRGRMSENISAVQMFMDNPLLGVGLANYEVHYQSYAQRLGLDPRLEDRPAHNTYLELMSELGLIGLFWFIAMQWITFKGLQQARKDFLAAGKREEAFISLAIGAYVIGFLFTGLFVHLAHPRFFWLLYGIALAVPHVAKKELSAALR